MEFLNIVWGLAQAYPVASLFLCALVIGHVFGLPGHGDGSGGGWGGDSDGGGCGGD